MKLFLLCTAHQEKPWIHPVLCEFPAKGRERERGKEEQSLILLEMRLKTKLNNS